MKKLHQDAKLPSYAHPGDAGLDLFALEETQIRPGQHAAVQTGIALEFPEGYVALIWDKSGLANKHRLKVVGGVYDAGYRGEYTVGMINLSDKTHVFKKGDKVAQILMQQVEHAQLEEVDELSDSSRGAGRWGSTGK